MKKKNAHPQSSETTALNKFVSDLPIDLFPETLLPVVAAHFPTAHTRAGEALAALLTGPQNQADYDYGWRLAAYVYELYELGWRFTKRYIVKPGCRAPIAEYSIDRAHPGSAAAIASRQKGFIDASLLSQLALAVVCLMLLIWWPF